MRRIHARLAKVGGALCALVLSVIGCSPRQTTQNGGGRHSEILMGDVALPTPTGVTNSMPEGRGLIALPPRPPATNAPVIMGKIALPAPQPPTRTDARVLMGEISVVPNSTAPGSAK